MIEEKLIHRALTTIKSSVITSRMAAAVCLCVVAVCGTEYRTQRKEERDQEHKGKQMEFYAIKPVICAVVDRIRKRAHSIS